ncbi:MAG: FAD:protein FMN transferase [Oscillospiraceae bacterium]|nr:FAD:protein FMN transferase [Oscillospiraceae bacterium]
MKGILIAGLILISLGSLVGCSQAEPERATIFAMDTVMTLTIYGDEASAARQRAAQEIHRLEELFSVTLADSDIARINQSAGESVTVEPETAAILAETVAIWRETGGAFSPALHPVLQAWGFTTGAYQIPDADDLTALLAHTNPADIMLDGTQVTVPAGMELDLGAVVKGYAGDVLAALMVEMGIETAIFSLGGDVYAVGERPGGGPWRVAIRDPFGDGDIGVVGVRDQIVSTSGSYERYFIGPDGVAYHHILDPATGRPAESGLVSVTVIASNGTRGDAISTALFVMGLAEGAIFAAQRADIEVIFVTEAGELHVTEGLKDRFTPGDGRKISWI